MSLSLNKNKIIQVLILVSCGALLGVDFRKPEAKAYRQGFQSRYEDVLDRHESQELYNAIQGYKALEEEAVDDLFFFNYGLALQQLGDSVEAIKKLEIGLSRNKSNPGTHLAIGIAKISIGKHREGCTHIKQSANLGDTIAIQWLTLNNIKKCVDPADPVSLYSSHAKA